MSAAHQCGIQVDDVTVGDGEGFKTGRTLFLHYTLTLSGFAEDGGVVVDSSRNRGRLFKYNTNSVIKGWDLGVQGMKAGGRRKLVVPPAFGYGEKGAGSVIPPNSMLYFDIELIRLG